MLKQTQYIPISHDILIDFYYRTVFEEHEPYIDAVKTNLHISAGYTEIEIYKLYSEFCSPLKSKKVRRQKLTVAKETSQFLPLQ